MYPQARALCAARARVVKAMAHPTRLLVVDELSRHGQRCVHELTEMVGVDISTVSRHLSVLKNAGVICDEKQGQQVFYRLKMSCVLGFLKCVDTLVKQAAKNQQELVEN